jgi:hypothetical protein
MRTPTIGLATFLVACTGDPISPTNSQGTAALIGGSLRVIATNGDPTGERIESSIATRNGDPTPPSPIQIDGAPLSAASAEIAAIGDHAYLVWLEANNGNLRSRGAPLDGNMAIDSGTAIELGSDGIELRRVGNALLAVHEPITFGTRTLSGSWIGADGTVTRMTDLPTTDQVVMTDDPDGRAGVWAIAFAQTYWNQGPDLMIERRLPDGTSLDGTGLLIAVSNETGSPNARAIAALPGGDILLIYEMRTGDMNDPGERHAARISRADGTITDRIVDLPASPITQLVAGDRVLALTIADTTATDVPVEARILDASGNMLSGPVSAGTVENGHFAAVATPDGFALVHRDAGFPVTWLDRDGNAIAQTAP